MCVRLTMPDWQQCHVCLCAVRDVARIRHMFDNLVCYKDWCLSWQAVGVSPSEKLRYREHSILPVQCDKNLLCVFNGVTYTHTLHWLVWRKRTYCPQEASVVNFSSGTTRWQWCFRFKTAFFFFFADRCIWCLGCINTLINLALLVCNLIIYNKTSLSVLTTTL